MEAPENKMKVLQRNAVHDNQKSHDCLILEYGSKKIKMTYECYNAGERFKVEFFDGDKWNTIYTLPDLGLVSDIFFYLKPDLERFDKASKLFDDAQKMCKLILD